MNSKPSRKLPWTSPAAVPPFRAWRWQTFCGQTDQAKPLVDEFTKRYPEDTLIHLIWLAVIRAAINLRRSNAAQTIEQLQTTLRYKAAAEFWLQYLRGLAWLRLGRAEEATAQFQRILDRRGEVLLSALYPLAKLGVERATALTNDVARSRKAFEEFFALWSEADLTLPILTEAKRDKADKKSAALCIEPAPRRIFGTSMASINSVPAELPRRWKGATEIVALLLLLLHSHL